jgi:hypothetical protein
MGLCRVDGLNSIGTELITLFKTTKTNTTMARLNYPEEFIRQTALFKKIKAKHDADGGASVLIPFLAQQGIDLNDDNTATTAAIAKDTLFDKATLKAEDDTQDRNNLFNPVVANMKVIFQYLKKFYAKNPAELGLWGATMNGNAIVYPPEFEELVKLFRAMKAKHDSFGPGGSPLTAFLDQNEIEIASDDTKVNAAETKHDEAKQGEKDAEDLREDRDNLFDPVMANVLLMGQFLKGLFVKNPKELGHWGYVVDDSPRDPKFRESTITSGIPKTLTGVKLGSQVENTGTVPLLLHKGDEVGAEPVNLLPEMRFTVVRGWGTMTVENQDPAQEGKIGWLTVDG